MAISQATKRFSTLLFAAASLALPIALCSTLSVRSEDKPSDVSADAHATTTSKQETKSDAGADSSSDSGKAVALDWQGDFDKAMEKAKEEKKLVLVDVYTDWCVYCKKLDREVYTNPEISKYLAEKFIVVKANAEDNAMGEAFANKFDTHAYPTILVFDYKSVKEKPKARIFGYLPPAEFDTAMHTIVESKKYKQKKHKAS